MVPDNVTLSSPLEFRTAFNRFGGYCVPLGSIRRPASQTIVAGQVWEPDTIAFMVDTCGGLDVVHAGTFFGDFLPALARAASTVWAFEPNRENFRCAAMTATLNGLTNVQLHLGGLSDHAGQMSLQTRASDGEVLGGASRLVDRPPSGIEVHESTPVAPLDSVLPPERPISIIQLDVEGHEQQALTGALESIRRWKPILILESMPHPDWVAARLAPLGYEFRRTLHDNSVLSVKP
jgi:FkbM family methyltransferase